MHYVNSFIQNESIRNNFPSLPFQFLPLIVTTSTSICQVKIEVSITQKCTQFYNISNQVTTAYGTSQYKCEQKISRADNISTGPIFVKRQHIRTIPLLMPALCDSGYPFCKLESTCLTMESIQDLLALLFVPTEMRLIFNRLSFK